MRWLLGLVIGLVVGAVAAVVVLPDGGDDDAFGPAAEWDLGQRQTDRLFDCASAADQAQTRCALDVMDDAGASRQAQDFFRQTQWFLQRFREFGVVDLGEVVVPWRANSNDDYLLLNGSPSFISVEREAPPIAVFGQDDAYEPLRRAVNATDDIPDEDDLVLWETDEFFEGVKREGQKIRFVFQWELKDSCHACGTGYLARVALEFAPDGTYLSAVPMNICWGGEGGDAERVENDAPRCPRPSSPS